jgi:hypothetical protein
MTSHGFRAMASTLLNESGLWHPDAIERALAHGEKDRVRAAYHRGAHWAERVRMAQWWSDYLDQLRVGGEVVKGKFRKRAERERSELPPSFRSLIERIQHSYGSVVTLAATAGSGLIPVHASRRYRNCRLWSRRSRRGVAPPPGWAWRHAVRAV